MCILEPPTPLAITATPNAIADYAAGNHYERLLVCATIISTMENISPLTREEDSSSNSCAEAAQRAVRQVCPLSAFILGGPMPPSPGLIPLCWEDLMDWTKEATLITEKVFRGNRQSDLLGLLPSTLSGSPRLRFLPYVSRDETDTTIDKLASQSYMERAQFYQENVIIAVQPEEDQDPLCLISLFQFCRYFTLIRRLDDSLELIVAYRPALADPFLSRQPAFESQGVNEEEIQLENSEADGLLVHTQKESNHQLPECVICLEKTEDSVLFCCSQAICSDCDRRWVRRRLCCPFCRQPFASVKEATQGQWQLSSAIPVEQIVQDIQCLGQKLERFWKGLGIAQMSGQDRMRQAVVLAENYVQRSKHLESSPVEDRDGFVLVTEQP